MWLNETEFEEAVGSYWESEEDIEARIYAMRFKEQKRSAVKRAFSWVGEAIRSKHPDESLRDSVLSD